MSRAKEINYNPAWTVKENAERNGVSEATIRNYIKINGIDRRLDRKQRIIDDCRKYLKKHPNATWNELQQKTGHSLATIRLYREYITTKKGLSDFNKLKTEIRSVAKERKKQEWVESLKKIPHEEIIKYLAQYEEKEFKKKSLNKNGKELWSDVLKTIPEMLQSSDKQDISKLRAFLFEKPEMPMLFIGSGGQQGSMQALFYKMFKGVGVALTPLQFASMSDECVRNSRIMLLSKGGKNDDINYASKRAVKLNPDNTAGITFFDSPENHLLQNLKGTSAKVFMFGGITAKAGFTSVQGKFLKYGIFYRAFTGEATVSDKIDIDLSPEKCFRIELNKSDETVTNLEKIEHLCVLYGSYGEPIAYDLESVITESGIASVQVCDYRNYCHGRFMFPTNHTENSIEPRQFSDVAMVLLVSPRERNLAKKIRELAVPIKTPIITIETEYDDILASLDMLVKSSVFIGYFGEQIKKVNPYSPPNYHAKNKEIFKPFPINIKFIQELRENGELNYVEKEPQAARDAKNK